MEVDDKALCMTNTEKSSKPFVPDLSTQKLNKKYVAYSASLLICPLVVGMIISQLGNSEVLGESYVNETTFKISKDQYNDLFSLGGFYPIGGMLGALVSANYVETHGRKLTTIVLVSIMIAGNLIGYISLLLHFSLLPICRFLVGFSSAGLMVSGVIWMFETLPLRIETYFKPLVQCLINFGIVLSSILSLNQIMVIFKFGIFFFPLFFSLIQIILCCLLPESVKWTLKKEQEHNIAESDLKLLRGEGYVSDEFTYLKDIANSEFKESKMSMKDFILNRRYRKAIFACIFMHIAQQLSGINAVMAFCANILTGVQNVDLLCLAILIINLGFSMIFCLITNRFMRKTMLVAGHMIMFSGYLIFIIAGFVGSSNSALKVAALCIVALGFQIGPGPLVWFVTLEIFPTSAVGAAQGLCSSTNWMANSLVFFIFPLLSKAMLQHHILIIFLVINLIAAIVSFLCLVETKGKTPEEILDTYNRKRVSN